ncbi:hypothetical protein SRABI102_03508 [Stenotrophomonas lactitubi]|nr:hypothetical protein SRABI122_03056 [Stenotrophomonas lactitubi]CAH0263643.1 hypothetical protein SRABI66_03522 [Stenotrophomonas lactitubi]CAH0264860.1 hypothetical protein SRABI81_03548 [Stenotrophomonas lactitubi]CAH0269299.1 hypothetical protein SRABI102_03508 [Stenotrophomonas lactitubi]
MIQSLNHFCQGATVIISIKDAWPEYAVERHERYVTELLTDESKKAGAWGGRYLGDFVARNRRAISVGSVSEITDCIADFQAVMAGKSEAVAERVRRRVEGVLNYSSFCKKRPEGWDAYALCKEFKYDMCPYCQQSLAITVFRDGIGAFRPTLDHFYPKYRFPFLGLSLYNLVPSCQSCNSSLKGAKDFFDVKHLHPYESKEAIFFGLDIDKYLESRAKGEKSWILSVLGSGDLAASKSISTFAIKERYEMLESLVDRFVASTYLRFSINEEKYKCLISSAEFQLELDELIGFSPSAYKNEFLGRMKLDLYELIRGKFERLLAGAGGYV